MANQTLPLNVSDEMKSDDGRQSFEGLECGKGLCSSSSDTTEELYSSSAPDACGDCLFACKELVCWTNYGVRARKQVSTP